MTEVDIAGIGIWSEHFANWTEFCAVLDGAGVPEGGKLSPELIPARERRRAPLAVKMAVEVMDQACRMAAVEAADVATVFASGMSDMQITDYMCRTLASDPRLVSPTKFHNSVHNASTGYWSIATHSHSPANAVCGYANSVAVAVLEGAVQAVEEARPVLVAVEELAAPGPFNSIYTSQQPLAAALLLAPPGNAAASMAKLGIEVMSAEVDEPVLTALGDWDLTENFAAQSLPLLAAIAAGGEVPLQMPLSGTAALSLTVAAGRLPRTESA